MASFEKAPVNAPMHLHNRDTETIIKIWSTSSKNIFRKNISIFVQTKENHEPLFIHLYEYAAVPLDLSQHVGKCVKQVIRIIQKELRKRIELENLLENKLDNSKQTVAPRGHTSKHRTIYQRKK